MLPRLLCVLCLVALAGIARADPACSTADLRLTGLRLVDVAGARAADGGWMDIAAGRVLATGRGLAPPCAQPRQAVDLSGRYLVPGFWDMHVHAHRDQRAEAFYPLFVAHGVLGIREMGTHLPALLAARAAWAPELDAPRVVWGSPVIDGTPTVLRYALGVQGPDEARAAVRLAAQLGFQFVKPYDRLTSDAYEALLDEARLRGLPVVGHVPLASSPEVAIAGKQAGIEHLTLLLEHCVPGALERARANAGGDSMALLTDGWLAARLETLDGQRCDALAARLASAGVRNTPTLVQLQGYAMARAWAERDDPRLALVRPSVREEWRRFGREMNADDARHAQSILRAHQALVRRLWRAGAPLMTGTDASSEPWVFPGDGVHAEMALLVEAGLPPAAALRAATIAPLEALGRTEARNPFAVGAEASFVVLEANPLEDIAATRTVVGVVLRGRWLDRAQLDRLRRLGIERSATAPPEQ